MRLQLNIKKGLYDRFRSLPMWQPAPLLGALAGDVFRYSVASAVILVVGLILGFRPAGGVLGVTLAVALVLVFCFAVSWLWIIVGMLVKSPESVMTTSFVFLMPLTFASDIFVQLSTMPDWLQAIVGKNPGYTVGARVARPDARKAGSVGCDLGTDSVGAHRAGSGADRDAPLSQRAKVDAGGPGVRRTDVSSTSPIHSAALGSRMAREWVT